MEGARLLIQIRIMIIGCSRFARSYLGDAVMISDRELDVVALAHPRQVGKLGAFSGDWHQLHQEWVDASS